MKAHDFQPANPDLIYFDAMGTVIPVVGVMLPEWAGFLVMTGAFLLVAAGSLIWIFFFRKARRRRRKHHHHHHSRPLDFPPSQKDGLPPGRPEEASSGPQSTP